MMQGIAIIGCGDMGSKHAAAWAGRDDAKIVAICDPQTERAAKLAETYGATQFERWQDAVSCEGVTVVSICVPACDHRDIAVFAANAGRHILCEKPMALTLAEADEMMAAARANSVSLSVCHQYRSLDRFRTMKRLIDEDRLGQQLFIRFTEMREVRPKLAMHRLSMNGGPVHDMSGHLFDLGRYLTGSEPLRVMATGAVFAKGKPRVASVPDFGIDTAEIRVDFHGGHCLTISINWGLPEHTPGHCHDLLHGEKGVAYTSDMGLPDRFLGDLSQTVSVALKDGTGTTVFPCTPDHDGPHPCIDDMITEITGGRKSRFSAEDGRAALRLILAALEAIETGETVVL